MSTKINILNSLRVRDCVIVRNGDHSHPSWPTSKFKYEGVVRKFVMDKINRGVHDSPVKPYLYVAFIDESAYHNLLLQGSPVSWILNNQLVNGYISSIERLDGKIAKMTACMNDGGYNMYPTDYSIRVGDIDCVLITEAYNLQSLSN